MIFFDHFRDPLLIVPAILFGYFQGLFQIFFITISVTAFMIRFMTVFMIPRGRLTGFLYYSTNGRRTDSRFPGLHYAFF